MVRLDAIHPGYGFAQNKGYGAPAIAALNALGVCRPHRRTFAPCPISLERLTTVLTRRPRLPITILIRSLCVDDGC
jgi:ribonuclease HII